MRETKPKESMKPEFKMFNYGNATKVKFKNTRVNMYDIEGGFKINLIKFAPEYNPEIPTAICQIIKDKVYVTTINLSHNGAIALYNCLRKRLLSKFKDNPA